MDLKHQKAAQMSGFLVFKPDFPLSLKRPLPQGPLAKSNF